MRICLSLIVAAFIALCSVGASAAEPGEVAVTTFLCESEQGALKMASVAETGGSAEWFAAAEETIEAGLCEEYMFQIPVVIQEKVYSFLGFAGSGEVWFGLAGPKGVPVYVIIGAKKTPA